MRKQDIDNLKKIRRQLAEQGFRFNGGGFVFDKDLDISSYMRSADSKKPKKSKRQPYSF